MTETVLAVGAIATALLAVGAILRRYVIPFFRRLTDFLDDWNGEPARPGHDPRPGVPERLANIEGEQSRVAKELETNGGASLKDSVKRTEDHLARIEQQQGEDRAVMQGILAAFGQFVGREQQVRLEGRRTEGEMWKAVQEISSNGDVDDEGNPT